MNVIVRTAAQFPWHNGLCEHHNTILEKMVTKAMANVQCDFDVVLGCSINTNTALYSVNGDSPNKLVFRRNPNILTVMNSWPPTLEKVSTR